MKKYERRKELKERRKNKGREERIAIISSDNAHYVPISGPNPMSSIRSASSRTKYCKSSKLMRPFSTKSNSLRKYGDKFHLSMNEPPHGGGVVIKNTFAC